MQVITDIYKKKENRNTSKHCDSKCRIEHPKGFIKNRYKEKTWRMKKQFRAPLLMISISISAARNFFSSREMNER